MASNNSNSPELKDSPQVTGVVIITLPPSDNPSLGKTITAFTFSDSSPQQGHDPRPDQRDRETRIPILLPSPPNLGYRSRFDSIGLSRRTVFSSLTVFAIACMLLSYSLTKNPVQLGSENGRDEQDKDDDDDDKERNSFVFPLYRKWSSGEALQGDVQLKLGRFAEPMKGVDDEFGSGKFVSTSASAAAAAIDSSTIFPVRGNIYPDGLYYTHMLVGKPQKPYFLDIDTGSDLTWIQCNAPCVSCAKGPHPLYNPRKENLLPSKESLCGEVQRNQMKGTCATCQQCDYEIEYADHSSSIGVLAKDEINLSFANGSQTKFDMVFGCAYDQQGMLLDSLKRTDGILGLSRSKVSLPSQLASKGIIKNVVGHCLTTNIGSGGYMFFGDDFVPNWGMVWVPMLNTPSLDFYQTKLMKMSHGSRRLRLSGGDGETAKIVFDSGSSYTYFTKQAYSDLVDSLTEVQMEGLTQDASDTTLPICWHAKSPIRSVTDVKHLFKTVTLQFESKWWNRTPKFQIPPESYLIISNKGNVCLGILDGSEIHDGSAFILGDISLRGQLIVYDNVNQKIGWGASDCAKPENVEALSFV